jgi:hypothetical protein
MTMLVVWVRRCRGAEVDAEDGERVATVRIRWQRSGSRLELQATYDRRFEASPDSLRDPSRQLLVGHIRGLLLPRRPCTELPAAWWCGTSRLVGDLVLWTGSALAVNPEQRLVATLLDAYAARRAELLPRTAQVRDMLLCVVCELDSCRLTEHGLETPTTRRLAAARAHQMEQRPETRSTPEPAPESIAPAPGVAMPADRYATPVDARQAEDLRRARGLDTEQRLALLKELFLPPDASPSTCADGD